MSKKAAFLAVSAITLVGAGMAIADTQRFPANDDIRSQAYDTSRITPPAQVAQPHADDYKGTNTPLPPISTVVFNGPTVLSQEELSALTQPYLDRPITDNDIAQLKTKIADEYVKRGSPLVKVTTPTQDLRSGQLVINIYEGHIGQVVANTNGVFASYIPLAFANRLNESIYDDKAARGVVNDLNEINNTSSSITLRPGLQPLTTDVVVNTKPGGTPDTNYIAFDNYGEKLTGRYLGSLHLEKTNYFGIGEKLNFDARASTDDLYEAGAGIKLPTGFLNTFFQASYAYSHDDIGDRLSFLNANGHSHIINLGLSGNVISDDDQKLTLRGGLDAREHDSFINHSVVESKDHVRRVYVGANYLGLYPESSSLVLLDAKLSKGVDILGASEKGDANLTRPAAKPEAIMFEPSIYARHDFTPHDTVSLFARGQMTGSTLLSSDMFILGGYGSVRGFEPAEEVGDQGWSFQGEYQHKIALMDELNLGVGPWIDGGHVYNHLSNQTLDNALYAAGLGAEFSSNIIPVGETKLRLDWAHPIGSYTSNTVADNTYYFRIEQDF